MASFVVEALHSSFGAICPLDRAQSNTEMLLLISRDKCIKVEKTHQKCCSFMRLASNDSSGFCAKVSCEPHSEK